MSVDQRLRAALTGAADQLPVDHTAALDVVVRRGVRRRRATRAGQLVAVAVALVGAAFVLDQRPFTLDRQTPAGRPDALVGTYVVDVSSEPRASNLGLSGRWVITLQADGVVDLVAPPGVEVIGGATYRATGDQLRTDLLVDRPGCQAGDDTVAVYRWSLAGDQLRFVAGTDGCVARALLMTGQPWQRQP